MRARYLTLSQASDALTRRRVVIAEDDDDIRELLAWSLQEDGFDVVAVRDGQELVDQVDSCTAAGTLPHLVITDVMMPRITGLEALAWLRDRGLDLPVIVVTAHDHHQVRQDAERLGATAVLVKPLDLDDFRTAVLHYGGR
jgi:CheY-like chemotaxis protein